MKVNGIEFDFDASDSVCIEKFENALDIMSEEEKELGKNIGNIKHHEFLSGYCAALRSFFLNSTGTNVLDGVTSVNKAIECYDDFLGQIKEAGEKTKDLISKYDPKRIK